MPSGVQTPQIDQPIYQPQQMAVPPSPQGQTAQVLPAQAGFVSKAGAGAYVANNILQGWMKGREVAKAQAVAKESNEQNFWNRTVAQKVDIAKGLRDTKGANDPEAQAAYKDMMTAWQQSLQSQQKYVQPENNGKKSKKQNFEGALGQIFGKSGVTPHDIPAAALKALSAGPPPGFSETLQDRQAMAATKASEAQAKLAGIETEGAEANLPVVKAKAEQEQQAIADDIKFTALQQKDPNTRKPEENSWLDMQQRVAIAKTKLSDPKKALLDQVSRQLMDGKPPLTDEQRSLAYASGLLQGPHSQITNKGLDQYVTTMSPDGKILSQVKVGREFHEDQVDAFQRMETVKKNMEYDGWARALGIPVTKERDNQRVWQMVQVDMAKKPEEMARLTDNPIQQEADMYTLTKALRSLQAESSGPGVNPEQKKATLSKWSNFYTAPNANDTNGMFVLRNPAALKDGKFAGGMDATALAKEHEGFVNRLRGKIGEQNKTWGAAEIDDFLRRTTPPQAGQSAGPGQLTPPPSAGLFHKQADTDQATMQPPPQGAVFGENKPGTKLYIVQTDQGPKQAYLTPELLLQVQEGGATVTPAQ